METTISNSIIRQFKPCYDPNEITDSEEEILSVKEWILKYESRVKSKADILWLICRDDFMTDKDLRLFAVWCARESLKLVKNPDHRSANACDVAERFANGDATVDELGSAESAAWSAAWSAAESAAWSAALSAAESAESAAESAAWSAALSAAESAESAAESAARSAQLKQLLTYF